MRIKDVQIRKNLEKAYKNYSLASSEADFQVALLGLHTALEKAFRSYLKAFGISDVEYYQINFPDLVNIVRDKTDLFIDDPGVVRLLVSLNTTRNEIAHPDEGKPSPRLIENDAKQFAKLIQRFWPSFFGGNFPASLEQSRSKPVRQPPPPKVQHQQEPPIIHPITQQRKVESIKTPSIHLIGRSKLLLKRLWGDERESRFQTAKLIRRMLAIYLLFTFSTWLKSASFFTARWPQPVKNIGVVLFILAGAVFLWGCIISGKIFAQLRLKRLLLFISFIYVFYIAIVLLTSDSNVPVFQHLLIANRRIINTARIKTKDAALALLDAPSQFRSLYSGHGNPEESAFTDDLDRVRLTPIPANQETEQMNSVAQRDDPTSTAPLLQINQPNVAFFDAFIYSIGFLENGNLLVTIQVQGEISGDFQGNVEGKAFECTILDAYPERLYCNGPGFEEGQQLKIRVFENSSNELVYEAEFTVPILPPQAPN